ncbi:hypothetical protein GCM10028833_04600 [Glycomyces tarimensis]
MVGFAGLASGLAAMVVLHATAGTDLALDVISTTLYSPLGWLLPVSLSLFALGASAFGVVARASAAPRWLGTMLFVWSGLIMLVALFPTDPPASEDHSAIHFVHRYAAFAAFCTMVVVGFAFSRWLGRADRAARAVAACSWVALLALTVTSLPYVLAFFGAEAPAWTDAAGFNQRMTVGSELVALALLGGRLRRGAQRPEPVPGPASESVPVASPAVRERELVAA